MCPGHAARAGRRAPRAALRRAGRRAGRGAGARTCTVELESRSKWFGDRIRKSNRVSKSKIEIYVEISLKRQEKQHLPHTRCHKKKQLETRQLADTHTRRPHTHTRDTLSQTTRHKTPPPNRSNGARFRHLWFLRLARRRGRRRFVGAEERATHIPQGATDALHQVSSGLSKIHWRARGGGLVTARRIIDA